MTLLEVNAYAVGSGADLEDVGGIGIAIGGKIDGTGGAMSPFKGNEDTFRVADHNQFAIDQAIEHKSFPIVDNFHFRLLGR